MCVRVLSEYLCIYVHCTSVCEFVVAKCMWKCVLSEGVSEFVLAWKSVLGDSVWNYVLSRSVEMCVARECVEMCMLIM